MREIIISMILLGLLILLMICDKGEWENDSNCFWYYR